MSDFFLACLILSYPDTSHRIFTNSNAQKGIIKSLTSTSISLILTRPIVSETATKVIIIINALNSLLRIKAFLPFIFCGFLNVYKSFFQIFFLLQTLVDMTSRPVKGARLYFSLALRIDDVDCPQGERNTSQVFLNLEVRNRAITQHNPYSAFPYNALLSTRNR